MIYFYALIGFLISYFGFRYAYASNLLNKEIVSEFKTFSENNGILFFRFIVEIISANPKVGFYKKLMEEGVINRKDILEIKLIPLIPTILIVVSILINN